MQSQEYQLACWSLGQRTTGATLASVDAAVAEGSVLRTHVLRPTWHFVAADDLRWMIALSGPLVKRKLVPFDSRGGLTPAVVARGVAAIAALMKSGAHYTRAQITAGLRTRRMGEVSGWTVGHLLMHAELDGIVCSGVPAGVHQTYTACDRRCPPTRLTRADALAELGRRYFRSHAPATLRDFRWWSGLSASDARAAVDACPQLRPVRVGDLDLLDWTSDEVPDEAEPRAHLLQPFDELVVAYTDSRHVVDAKRLLREPKADGLLSRIVLVDGQVAGRWRRELGRPGVAMQIDLAVPVRRPIIKALEDAAGRYAAFMTRPLASFDVSRL